MRGTPRYSTIDEYIQMFPADVQGTSSALPPARSTSASTPPENARKARDKSQKKKG